MKMNAEEKVKRLAKKKSNTICPNCGNVKKFGFGTVCIKFYTFVCNECKSSHQAISHRCKSTTMSTWTDAEVEELERKGNDYCRRTWLKNAPAEGTGGRPIPGSDISCYKRFVIDAYENKRYYGDDEGALHDEVPLATRTSITKAPVRQQKAKVIAKAPISAPLPPIADLLDFSAPSTSTSGAAQNITVQSQVIQNPTTIATKSFQPVFEANFDSQFNSAEDTDLVRTTKPPKSSNSTGSDHNIQSSTENLFKADFSQFSEAAPTTSNAFQPSFGTNFDSQSNNTSFFNDVKPAQAPASAGIDHGFPSLSSSNPDLTISSDFEGLTVNAGNMSAPKEKKPIMGTGGNSNASAISMMRGTTPQANMPIQMQHRQPQVMTQMQQQMAGTNYSQQQFQMSQQQMMTMMNNQHMMPMMNNQNMMPIMNNQNMMHMNMGRMNNGIQSVGTNLMQPNAMNVGPSSQGNLTYDSMLSQKPPSQSQCSKNNSNRSIGNLGFQM